MPLSRSQASLACQIGVISVARCSRNSGTSGAVAKTVLARTNAAGSPVSDQPRTDQPRTDQPRTDQP